MNLDRATSISLWWHGVLLAIALLCALWLVGPYGSLSVDEGAAALQAVHLERGEGWSYELPIPSIPDDVVVIPVDKAEVTDDGFATFARHPAYAVLLAASLRGLGHVGMPVLSIAGTVLAAVAAGHLALTFSTRAIAVSAVWVTGLGSPLLFDSFILIAHSLGAAAVGWALVSFLRGDDGDRIGALVLGAVSLSAGVVLRSEVLLVAVAIALAWGASFLRHRRRTDALIVLVAVLGAGAGLLLDRWWRSAIGVRSQALGGPSGRARDDLAQFLGDRVDAVSSTVWSIGDTRAARLVAAAGLLLVILALCVRLDVGRRTWRFLGGAAVVLLAARLVSADRVLVPEVLVAAPLLLVAAVLAVGRLRLERPARLLLSVVGVAALLVVATEYGEGGAVEWGGRYFAVLLPAAMPLALHAVWSAAPDREVRSAIVWPLTLSTGLLAIISVQTLGAINRRADDTLETVARIAVPSTLASAPSDDRPIIVTSEFGAVRLDWRRYDQHRWVFIDEPEHADLVRDAQVAAIADDLTGDRQVTLVTEDLDADLARLGEHRVVAEPRTAGPFTVAVVELGQEDG